MELRNYMEVAVEKYVDGIIEKMDVCTCEKCRLDIMAIALNNLPVEYVVTDEGMLYKKVRLIMESDYKVKVVTELTKAAEIVKKDARHYVQEEG